jgi:hypothetical protein
MTRQNPDNKLILLTARQADSLVPLFELELLVSS